MTITRKAKGQLLMIGTAIIFGLIGLFTKEMEGHVHGLVISFYRVFFGFILMLGVIPFLDKSCFHPKKVEVKHAFVLAIFFVISISSYILSLTFTSIQNTALLSSSTPFFVLIVAYFVLREKITWIKIATLVIAGIGLVVMNPIGSSIDLIGNLFALGSAIVFSFFTVFTRKFERHRDLKIVFWFFLFSWILLLPSVFIRGLGDLAVIWPRVLGIGLLCTGAAYLLFNIALNYIEAENGAIISMIVTPVVSITLGYFILHEALNFQTLLGGGILILSGILYEIFSKKNLNFHLQNSGKKL